MAEYVNNEIAWSCDLCLSPFLVVTTMCITMGKSLSVWAGLYSFFFFPQSLSLEAKLVVSSASQQFRGPVIGVVAIDYKFFHS